jgi:hypothetical protein
MPIKTYKDLNVFRESYVLALEVLAPHEDFQWQNNSSCEATSPCGAIHTGKYRGGLGKTLSRGGIQEVLADCNRFLR